MTTSMLGHVVIPILGLFAVLAAAPPPDGATDGAPGDVADDVADTVTDDAPGPGHAGPGAPTPTPTATRTTTTTSMGVFTKPIVWWDIGAHVRSWFALPPGPLALPGPSVSYVSPGLAVYYARTQPAAVTRFWVAHAVDFWLVLWTQAATPPDWPFTAFPVLSFMPVDGETSSHFGYRRHPISKRRKLHKGHDFKASRGTPVYAAGPGLVTHAGRLGTYGNIVKVSHGLGLETRYAHLQSVHTEVGHVVDAGELIGAVGSTGRSTGPHLHFEVRHFGEPVDPRWALALLRDDPATFANTP